MKYDGVMEQEAGRSIYPRTAERSIGAGSVLGCLRGVFGCARADERSVEKGRAERKGVRSVWDQREDLRFAFLAHSIDEIELHAAYICMLL
jgi:hypothetical protein